MFSAEITPCCHATTLARYRLPIPSGPTNKNDAKGPVLHGTCRYGISYTFQRQRQLGTGMQNRHDCKRLSIHNDLNHIAVLVVTAVEQLDLVLFAAANIEKTSHDSWICWMLQCERLWTEFIAG
ncbi:MAG: hypothetical protein KDA60_18565, partial [Planctomycetales bacterium]|nr:hypothetical protein [Planctomycetales bacterium]